MKKLQIGDVFEINTPNGNAYVQYVHQHKTIGELIRILPGLYQDNPYTLDELVKVRELYFVHFPLKAAHKQQIVKKIGNFNIPDSVSIPTYFRTDHIVKGEFLSWHIVDYSTWKIKAVKELTEEEIKLSPWDTWNDTLLIEKLGQQWTLGK
jgi:hypothetical protein